MKRAAITTLLAVLAAAGCTDDDTIEPELGSASAVIVDPDDAAAYRHGSDDQAPRAAAATFEGQFSSDARVEIAAEGGNWIALGSPASVLVTLQSDGEASTVHANAAVPVGAYSRVRLTLSGARADLEAGATLGGVTFGSDVSIRVGGADGDVVIEKTVEPFTVGADTRVRLVFDLNSEVWVRQETAEEEQVEDEEVQEAATADRTMEEQH